MQIIDNNSHLWGDDLKQALTKGSRVKIAASCFSIYAFEALRSELLQDRQPAVHFHRPHVHTERGD